MTTGSSDSTSSSDQGQGTRAKVVTGDGRQILFDGSVDECRTYVEQNFPRTHVQPGGNYGDEGPQPDVYVDNGGAKSTYTGGEWSDQQSDQSQTDTSSASSSKTSSTSSTSSKTK
jgi:hypothetical protein